MKTITTIVYSIDELDDRAKEEAREWYREGALDWDWYTDTIECFTELAQAFGFTVDADEVVFSGFCSQGDGASFKGTYKYNPNMFADVFAKIAPDRADFREILFKLACMHSRCGNVTVNITRDNSHSCHEMTMRASADDCAEADIIDAEVNVLDVARDLARWLYRTLEREHDYLLSDECVDEAMRANEYTFTKDGERFG